MTIIKHRYENFCVCHCFLGVNWAFIEIRKTMTFNIFNNLIQFNLSITQLTMKLSQIREFSRKQHNFNLKRIIKWFDPPLIAIIQKEKLQQKKKPSTCLSEERRCYACPWFSIEKFTEMETSILNIDNTFIFKFLCFIQQTL